MSHDEQFDALGLALYVPGGQVVHEVEPATSVYVVGPQSEHIPDVPLWGAYVPVSHSMQLMTPVPGELMEK